MQYLKKELAVQSYCLRHFTPLGVPVAAKKLLETGMTYIGIGTPEKTLEEIGDELHLTRERVRQIKEKAIRKLNTGQRSHILQTYLG